MIDRYAVFGNPIAQSKSPQIHEAFAASFGETILYTRELVPIDGFRAAVLAFRARGGRGANVTAPFKMEAASLADRLSNRARLAGAANALRFEGDAICGENFDGLGLVQDIECNLGVSLLSKRVLILGAGGAARGVLEPLLAAKPAVVVVANRTAAKAESLARDFEALGPVQTARPTDLKEPFDVVLNCTSASLTDEAPECNPRVFGRQTLAYDLAYGKGLTPFLALAQAQGAGRLADGIGMLVEQAALAYEWWRGKRPRTAGVIEMLRTPLVPTAQHV